MAPAALLRRGGHWVGHWIALAATLPVLLTGLIVALPRIYAGAAHWGTAGFQRSAFVAAVAAVGAVVWTARRRRPFSPAAFLVITTIIGAYLRFLYALAIEPEWTSDFLTYWLSAQQQVTSGDFTATGFYTERTLPLLVPLIQLLGPVEMHVVLVNIAMLGMLQLIGYDILRRTRSHQAAQAFTVAFLLAPLPYFVSTIPSHDLWAMWMIGICCWLLTFLSAPHAGRWTWRAALAGPALALGCMWLELQRGIGLVMAAALVLAAGVAWLMSFRAASPDQMRVRRNAGLLCIAVLLAQVPLGAAADALSLRAKQSPAHATYATAYFASNGTSFGDGRWDWFNLFRQDFTAHLEASDTARLEAFAETLVLSDWSEQPMKRITNAGSRMAGLFAFDESNYWYFHGLDPALQRPARWLQAYSSHVSLLFALALLLALARLAFTPPPSTAVLAGLVLTAVAALALATFSENQARYLLWLWFIGPLLLAESFGRGVAVRWLAPRPGLGLLAGSLGAWLLLLLLLWLPAGFGYEVEDGRILGDWQSASGSLLGDFQAIPPENPLAHVTQPGRLAFTLGNAGANEAVHEVCLSVPGQFSLSFYLNAPLEAPPDTQVLVRMGERGLTFGLPQGEPTIYREHRIPGIPGSGTCQPLSFSLSGPAERVDVYFVRFEPDPAPPGAH